MNRSSFYATQDYAADQLQQQWQTHHALYPQYFGPRLSGDYGTSYSGGLGGRVPCYQDGSRQTRELLSKASNDVIRFR